jgi:adenylate cyclase
VTATVREALQALGVPSSEIERAGRDGTLVLLAIEHLVLPDPARYTLDDLAERANMPSEQVAQFWRALGFPDTRPGEAAFSDDDVAMLGLLSGLIDSGVIDSDLAVQMTRVIGSSVARIALSQVESFGLDDEVDTNTNTNAPANGSTTALPPLVDRSDFVDDAEAVLSLMPRAMEYVWRRHMQAAARSMVLRASAGEAGDIVQAVGFADLVGFTALSQQVDSHELAEVVDRFEGVAYDTVTRLGGRVVKMIGDEVMFTAPDAAHAADIGLSLSEVYGDDDALSDVRVGIALGPVLVREGDCYGPVVNLASRIVGIAFAGSVVVAESIHEALADDDRYHWRSLHRR